AIVQPRNPPPSDLRGWTSHPATSKAAARPVLANKANAVTRSLLRIIGLPRPEIVSDADRSVCRLASAEPAQALSGPCCLSERVGSAIFRFVALIALLLTIPPRSGQVDEW